MLIIWPFVRLPVLFCLTAGTGAKKGNSAATEASHASSLFPLRAYKDFQISSGTAGNAASKAEELFIKPLKGVKLSEISANDLDHMHTMSREAVQNEEKFNEALASFNKSKDPIGRKLQNGKIANKILKLLSAKVILQIKMAKDPKANFLEKIQELTKKLNKNIRLDEQQKGKPQMSYLELEKSPKGNKNTENGHTNKKGGEDKTGQRNKNHPEGEDS